MKKPTITKLKKKLDEVFSQYIRLKYADDNGMVACYTSGVVKHWKEIHCGHFISRRHLSTRWDERNCRPQTPAENLFNQGNAPEFAKRLIKEHGCDIIDELTAKSNQLVKMNLIDYQDLIQLFTEKLKNVEK